MHCQTAHSLHATRRAADFPGLQPRMLVLISSLILMTSCGGGGDPTGPGTTPVLAAHTASSLTGTVGQPVSTRPAVRVTRRGEPLSGATVTFTVASGGGSVTGGSQTTDAAGVAAVGGWTLGPAAGEQILRATMDGASGSPLTFAADAQAGPPTHVTVQAGANQNGLAHRPVPIVPAVLVTDQFDNPAGGISVVFAVETGGGEVTGASATTSAQGIASVGSWVLGGVIGEQRLTATAQGGGLANNPLTFTAQAAEFVLQPAADTVVGAGLLRVTRMIIPAGRTVSTGGAISISADGEVVIAGTLAATCHALELMTPGTLTVSGTIAAGCPQGGGGSLRIVAEGGYAFDGSTIEAAGHVQLGTSPPAQPFGLFGNRPAGWHGALSNTTSPACSVGNSEFRPVPERASNGADGVPSGENGGNGFEWSVSCGGDLSILGNVTIRGQSGGDGGNGTHTSAIFASATGGQGGRGGITRLISETGQIRFSGPGNRVETGLGGHGGVALAEALGDPLPAKAPGARAVGGLGAIPGALDVDAAGGLVILAPIEIFIGLAGDGGGARAVGAPGRDATTTQAAQGGGDAEATGGRGGNTPQEVFTHGALTAGALGGSGLGPVTGGDLVMMLGGTAGHGGDAEVDAGDGGNGSQSAPDGAPGGQMKAQAGHGGIATIKDLQNVAVGQSGDGGDAFVTGGNGGNGANRCLPNPLEGGRGGPGGAVIASAGAGGSAPGSTPGFDGSLDIQSAANGGHGGEGNSPGTGGAPGDDSMVPLVATAVNSFIPGSTGQPCPGALIVTVLASGSPLQDAFVGVSGPTPGTATTGPDGRAIFTNRAPGAYGIIAQKAGFVCSSATAMLAAGSSDAVIITCSPASLGPAISLLVGFYAGPGSAILNECLMAPSGTFGPTIVLGPGAGQLTWKSLVDIIGAYVQANGSFLGAATTMSGPIEITESVDGTFDLLSGTTPRFRGLLGFHQRNTSNNTECRTIYFITVLKQGG